MTSQDKLVIVANKVVQCPYCMPLSGCIVSDLKGKNIQEIISRLSVLTDDAISQIISFHESCPYQDRMAI